MIGIVFITISIVLVPCLADHEMRIVNNCDFSLNIGIRGDEFSPANGGFKLDRKQTRTVNVPQGWTSGRIWGRTGCGANNCCETGDCGHCKLECGKLTGEMDVTLAEFGMDKWGGNDFYDVSLVDAYNLPMKIEPIPGTFKTWDNGKYDCKAATCLHNMLSDCPNELKEFKNGKLVSCLSACSHFKTQEYCCPYGSKFGTKETCKASNYAHHFKQRCPQAYSYAFDDDKSTFTCRAAPGKTTGYITTFCP